ncbi:response regulator transcription factor [Micromonospora sp. KC721]|uniref:response regulator transcription factor n=1 Tax=Micromonospora sp. KC721 TaxID=2530380 RepID=UPI001048990A|nr:response regulator transcription factor [Micromonospora sp. KC721]TDB81551.1 response regulator transcription factor [Micromonospora sp. KC721]
MRLLLVEDDVRMAALLKRGLEREGYAVDLTVTGQEALRAGTQFPYDGVVLDAMIPAPDGFEVCRRLRQADRWMPVIMLTARGAVDDRVRGLDAGADDYLLKPFSFAELFARLRALLRRDVGERPVVLAAGDLRLDPASREVSRGGVAVSLSAREFALLHLLLRRKGEVLSRTAILEHVWESAYDGTSNMVDVYIRFLRAKVDRPFGRCAIETVRGTGYRLRPDGG